MAGLAVFERLPNRALRMNSAVSQPADVAVAMSSEEQIRREMLWPSNRRLSSALIRCNLPFGATFAPGSATTILA
jgi:hypothetical protein